MLTEEELDNIISKLDPLDPLEIVQSVYRMGYEKAVSDMVYLDETGILFL